MSNKTTRKDIDLLAIQARSAIYKKIRIPVMIYFARLGAYESPDQILRWLIILVTTFVVTSAPNLKAATQALGHLRVLLDAEELREEEQE